MTEIKSAIEQKASRKEINALNKKIDDLENRSKRNNVVIWGLKEGAEKDCSSIEEFLKEELFSKHMHGPRKYRSYATAPYENQPSG